jgi:glycosyltransferase involved in cell wall biosynthesis
VFRDEKTVAIRDVDNFAIQGVDADWFSLLMSRLDFGYLRLVNPGLAEASDQEIALAYLNAPADQRLDPHAEFSSKHYLHVNSDVAAAGIDPFFHFVHYGESEGRERWLSQWGDPSVPAVSAASVDHALTAFDVDLYVSQKPELKGQSPRTLVAHYLARGWRLGLEPFAGFFAKAGITHNDHFANDSDIPLLSWLREQTTKSMDSGLKDSKVARVIPQDQAAVSKEDIEAVFPFFDAEYYKANNADVVGDAHELVTHFMTDGWREGRDPSPSFSVDFYRETYSDIAENGINPFLHYVLYGKSEGRRPRASERQIITFSQDARITPPHLYSVLQSPTKEERAGKSDNAVDLNNLDLHWIVPDFSRGGGGHMTIFRTIRMLEQFGHRNTIWIENPTVHADPEDAWQDIIKYFQCVRSAVRFVSDGFFDTDGDAVIATGWTTAYLADRTDRFLEKFYFVQDHESQFYPTGAEHLLAEETYKFDLACICASPWLKQLMEERYGRWAKSFNLAYDEKVYQIQRSRSGPAISKANSCRIAVYARDHTARRCVTLVLMALELLGRNRHDFEVYFFGQDTLPFSETNFSCVNMGVLNAEELAVLYNDCDIGICFSGTNYSLVPQEMMACGLPVLELNSQSTRDIFPEGVVTLVGPDPAQMCDEISRFIDNDFARAEQSKKAALWVSQFSWEKSGRDIENAIREKFSQNKELIAAPKVKRVREVRLDVVIPTFNGLSEIKTVINSLRQQEASDAIQIHCVDSSSSDGTYEWLAQQRDIALTAIPQSEFGHGRTRNSGASQGSADIVSFLTQDAVPASRSWATDILKMFDHVPAAAGLTGRHIPYPEHPLFVRVEIENHFSNMLKYPLTLSKFTDPARWESGDLGWRQLLHFYSDNNSAMRRCVWREFPYQDVEYGEDQIWAREIIEAGLTKLYAPTATVYHSHYYSPNETYKRSRIEGEFFYRFFGYELENTTEEELQSKITKDQREFLVWARRNHIAEQDVEIGHANIEQKYRGLRDGLFSVLAERDNRK